jgi:hypothetical protein
MKKMQIYISILFILTLTACGRSDQSSFIAAEAGSIDLAVSDLLPKGSFYVTGLYNNAKVPFSKIEGYVRYGDDPDGSDCEADYILTDVRRNAKSSPNATKQRSVHSTGQGSWYQDISDPDKLGEWLDSANPNSSQILMMFTPNLIVDDFGIGAVEGAGSGQLCSIPLMARIMSLDSGELIFDTNRSLATINARIDRWLEGFVDATGLVGSERDRYIAELRELGGQPSYDEFIESSFIEINSSPDGSFEIVQSQISSGLVSVRLLFTPTPERYISPVSGVTFFELIANEVKSSGLSPAEFIRRTTS